MQRYLSGVIGKIEAVLAAIMGDGCGSGGQDHGGEQALRRLLLAGGAHLPVLAPVTPYSRCILVTNGVVAVRTAACLDIMLPISHDVSLADEHPPPFVACQRYNGILLVRDVMGLCIMMDEQREM